VKVRHLQLAMGRSEATTRGLILRLATFEGFLVTFLLGLVVFLVAFGAGVFLVFFLDAMMLLCLVSEGSTLR
jgi:VanZ family protein